MSTQVNVVSGVFVGEYGDPISLTVVDDDGQAVDVSTYTGSITVSLLSPDELKRVDLTGSFVTDGSDGKISATPQSGDIDREGDWHGQIKLTKTGVVAKSYIFKMSVGKGIAT